MSSSDRRLKRTRVSTRRWRKAWFGVAGRSRGVDPVIAPGEQAQALRRVEQRPWAGWRRPTATTVSAARISHP